MMNGENKRESQVPNIEGYNRLEKARKTEVKARFSQKFHRAQTYLNNLFQGKTEWTYEKVKFFNEYVADEIDNKSSIIELKASNQPLIQKTV